MATVNVVTAERTLEIEAASVTGGTIDGSSHLILTTHDGTEIDAGEVGGAVADASTTVKGAVELATDVETQTGTDAIRAVTPFGMASVVASATAKGLVELATSAEVATGTDTVRAVTPAGLAALVASLTAKGIVELATTTETTTGTDATRAVTPAGVQAVRDLLQPIDSDLTAIAALSATNDDVIQRKSGAWTNRTMAQLATDLAATGEFPDIILNGTDADGAKIYVATTDPGSVTNGSIWYQI